MLEDKHITIPKKVETEDHVDFQFLRKQGISYIENLGGKLWTDFNSHDPGITMLEVLSYAITDLGLRINSDITDILSSKDQTRDIHTQFLKASEILPSRPVNELDYRKLFIDIGEDRPIKNCWLSIKNESIFVDCKTGELTLDKASINSSKIESFNVKGLYTVYVDFNENITEEEKTLTKRKIVDRYHTNRGLCEDLVEIKAVETQKVAVCGRIEVENDVEEELVHAKVLRAIKNYLNPEVNFYSLSEMLGKGFTTDEIFDGPVLDNGFIDTEELRNSELRREVRLSDLIALISKVEGVKEIKEISLADCGEDINALNEWILCIEAGKKPELCELSSFSYSKGTLPLNINKAKVDAYVQELETEEALRRENARADKTLDIPSGNDNAMDTYSSILNDFPDTYGVGTSGIIGNNTTERKALAKQLKGYLLFFDKILASYFKHLEKVKDLLSYNGTLKRTYFAQALKGINGFDELVNDYEINDDNALTDALFKNLDNNVERKNQILDHLIARFAEQFSDYVFLMKELYGNSTDEIVLNNKKEFLKAYKEISSERSLGYNYLGYGPENLWDTDNVSGVQKRIAHLLGIKNYDRRNVSDSPVVIINEGTELEPEYKWKVKNLSGNIILASVNTHNIEYAASKELNEAVFQAIQIDEEALENRLNDTLLDGDFVGNIKVKISGSDNYYFEVVDDTVDKNIIARHNPVYTSESEFKDALRDIIKYLKYDFTEEGIFLVEHLLLKPVTRIGYEQLGIGSMVIGESFIIGNLPCGIGAMSVDGSLVVGGGSELPDLERVDGDYVLMDSCEEDCEINVFDPYSYRVSIVLPGYTYRFSNPDFRRYAETVIRQELPAHVIAKICWVGDRQNGLEAKSDLTEFEKAYRGFLLHKADEDCESQLAQSTENLISAITNLNNIYPPGRLLDCDQEENDDLDGKIILGQSNI